MSTWKATDGHCEIAVAADTAEEAAQEYVDGGDWGDNTITQWIDVMVWREEEHPCECSYCDAVATEHDAAGNPACAEHAEPHDDGVVLDPLSVVETVDEETVTVTLDPDEPDCSGDEHEWAAPYKLVRGIRENPGVWGHGGGVIINEVCLRCGCARVTDTWAQDPATGVQGLRSVAYYEVGDEDYPSDVTPPLEYLERRDVGDLEQLSIASGDGWSVFLAKSPLHDDRWAVVVEHDGEDPDVTWVDTEAAASKEAADVASDLKEAEEADAVASREVDED